MNTPILSLSNSSSFSQRLITWQKIHGRHHLPWQVSDPYCVWLSEMMLQQTQVSTVLTYYPRFLATFPTVQDLANAEQDAVLALWAGLGYYSRARNLHKAARQIVYDFGGQFPTQRIELEKLCGVGRSTAAAISAFAFQQRETILDGNVKRVLCRVFERDGNPSDKVFERSLWQLAENLLPENQQDMPSYTQGLMDLGATVCTRSKPKCDVCPMAEICLAKAHHRVAELPRKKTPIAIKAQTLYWLILKNQEDKVFVVKRPQKGIWAGLYCVPCFEDSEQFYDFIEQNQLERDELYENDAIAHRLTHRQLEILPFHYFNHHQKPHIQSLTMLLPKGVWLSQAELLDYGLPKPLQDYLQNKVFSV